MTTITDHRFTRLTRTKIKASAQINLAGQSHSVSYIIEENSLYRGIEPFLMLALLPSMVIKETIELDKPVSPRLLANIETIQELYQNCNEIFHRIKVNSAIQKPLKSRSFLGGAIPAELKEKINELLVALTLKQPGQVRKPEAKLAAGGKRKVGCFFSGGVDSFYTLLKHFDEIDSLIFVSGGFDIFPHPNNAEMRQEITERLRRLARQLDKEFIEVEAHIQIFSDTYVDWTLFYPSAMVALAQLLSNRFRKLYIAAAMDYRSQDPSGFSSLTDKLWSTERIEICLDGNEADRVKKIAEISASQMVLDNLRVCMDYSQGRYYNCGKCRKCLMVMTVLRAVNKLGDCPVFASSLDLEKIARSDFGWSSSFGFGFWREVLLLAEKNEQDPALLQAVRECLASEQQPDGKINYLRRSIAEYQARLEGQARWAESMEDNNILKARQFETAAAWGHSLAKELKPTGWLNLNSVLDKVSRL